MDNVRKATVISINLWVFIGLQVLGVFLSLCAYFILMPTKMVIFGGFMATPQLSDGTMMLAYGLKIAAAICVTIGYMLIASLGFFEKGFVVIGIIEIIGYFLSCFNDSITELYGIPGFVYLMVFLLLNVFFAKFLTTTMASILDKGNRTLGEHWQNYYAAIWATLILGVIAGILFFIFDQLSLYRNLLSFALSVLAIWKFLLYIRTAFTLSRNNKGGFEKDKDQLL